MAEALTNKSRERMASFYTRLLSFAGCNLITLQLFYIDGLSNEPVFLILVLFTFLTEYYSIIIWRIAVSLSFPLLYTMVLLFGLPVTVLAYAFVLFMVHLLKQRSFRVLFYTPAQQTISLVTAFVLADLVVFPQGMSELNEAFISVVLVTFVYYLINNLLVDILLKIRAQKYSKGHWIQKNVTVLLSMGLSLAYLFIMFLLGSQNRGIIDFFSYLFFFSPLVAISLISSIIVRLQKERNRLKSMLSLTTELNRLLPSKEWRQNVESLFEQFIDVEATVLWVRADEDWLMNYQNGAVIPEHSLSKNDVERFNSLKETIIYHDRKKEVVPGASVFHSHIRTFICTPFIIEDETAGMLIVGRSRSNSFTAEEARSMATLGNQMAVLLKNYHLISEQKKRLLLEERNRIAREIHDGIAQSVAGAVMKLETSQRLTEKNQDKADKLTFSAIEQLRNSLKEIRQSIYALRPYPTERKGLRQAIKDKIHSLQNDSGPQIIFRESGQIYPLPNHVERVIYETIQESLQNAIKHADAKQVETVLDYQNTGVTLIIQDNGAGFSLADAIMKARETPHYGILNINEQAEKIGASLQIDSTEGEGTKIQLEIPNHEAGEKVL